MELSALLSPLPAGGICGHDLSFSPDFDEIAGRAARTIRLSNRGVAKRPEGGRLGAGGAPMRSPAGPAQQGPAHRRVARRGVDPQPRNRWPGARPVLARSLVCEVLGRAPSTPGRRRFRAKERRPGVGCGPRAGLAPSLPVDRFGARPLQPRRSRSDAGPYAAGRTIRVAGRCAAWRGCGDRALRRRPCCHAAGSFEAGASAVSDCLATLDALEALLEARLGAEAPGWSATRDTLQTLAQTFDAFAGRQAQPPTPCSGEARGEGRGAPRSGRRIPLRPAP